MPQPTRHEGNVESYPEQFVTCRAENRHPWRFETDFRFTTNTRGRVVEFSRIRTCPLCDAEQVKKFRVLRSGSFEQIGQTKINYRDGYLVRRTNPLSREALLDAMLLSELGKNAPGVLNEILNQRPRKLRLVHQVA